MTSYPTVISSRGQVVIPAELREKLGLAKGIRATWIEENGRLVLSPLTEQRLKAFRGFLKPKPDEPSMFEEHLAERERERERERRRD